MDLRFQYDCHNVDWKRVKNLLAEVGMSAVETEKHQLSFENSYAVIFVYDEDKLIGIGRSISDGIRQSALYDIAIDPAYQGIGLGRKIVLELMEKTPSCNFILYASPGKEGFYKKLKYKKMKTGMILFTDSSRMENSEFIED
ncbi:MAG TPA: GNAT family N-acetyltransferase [Dysgonomonas sp.]|nr:GNAT family N-acetyltransferase [Dysgonomonas sp.]